MADTLPPELQLFRTRAVEIARNLPDDAFAEDDFVTPDIDPVEHEEILIRLMAFEE